MTQSKLLATPEQSSSLDRGTRGTINIAGDQKVQAKLAALLQRLAMLVDPVDER